jgi:aspartyl-tRNA(Asn)/glutamyl-tRNA(Gln) amidotransferase subunit B
MMSGETVHTFAEILIGLEIHCQLTSLKTKLFCGCSTDYRRDPPNTHVCPVCLGIPGALPSLNRKAVEDALAVSLALNSHVARKSYFFRKNYYYPDMPKNFQISQYDKAGGIPIARGGRVEIQVNHGKRRIRIIRLQLEEDPAKLVHLGPIDASPYTLVDYNRAGVALLEIVTAPDLRSPREARIFLQKLRSILEHLGVSDGRFEGSMRCDANISLSGGKRVEVKNISSFKEVERALSFEMTRQKSVVSRGSRVGMETRHWDEARRLTIALRSKEEEHDYRYFPEPDLIPVVVSDEWVKAVEATLPELPDRRRERLVQTYQITAYDATVLTGEKALADFFEACAEQYSDAKRISNWVIGDLLRWLHEYDVDIEEANITPKALVEMITLIDEGVISGKIAKTVLPEILRTGKSPREIVEKKALMRLASPQEIEGVVNQVFAENPQAVQDALVEEKAIHYLVGQVMRATGGKADPQLTNQIVRERMKEARPGD